MAEYKLHEDGIFKDNLHLSTSFWAESENDKVLVRVLHLAVHQCLNGKITEDAEINFVKENVDKILKNISLNINLAVEEDSQNGKKKVLVIKSDNIKSFIE